MDAVQNKAIYELGYWFALAAFIASVGYDIAQILQIAGAVQAPTVKPDGKS